MACTGTDVATAGEIFAGTCRVGKCKGHGEVGWAMLKGREEAGGERARERRMTKGFGVWGLSRPWVVVGKRRS